MVDFAIDQMLGMFALVSYVLVIFLFIFVIVISRRLKKVLHIIEPLRKLQDGAIAEPSQDEKFLRATRDKAWDVEKDSRTDKTPAFALERVEEESVEEPEKIVIQKPPLVDLSDKLVDDVLESVKEAALSEQTAKKDRKHIKRPTLIETVVETADEEPIVVVETEPAPRTSL